MVQSRHRLTIPVETMSSLQVNVHGTAHMNIRSKLGLKHSSILGSFVMQVQYHNKTRMIF